MHMVKRKDAGTRTASEDDGAAGFVVGSTTGHQAPLANVSREPADTPPTTVPPRPRTIGPRLHPARLGEYIVVPRRRV